MNRLESRLRILADMAHTGVINAEEHDLVHETILRLERKLRLEELAHALENTKEVVDVLPM